MLHGYPIPAIFLYKRSENGVTKYDVIDGKQRLETIFRFVGLQRPIFDVKTELPGSDKSEIVTWHLLKKRQLQPLIDQYDITTIEIDGEIGEVIDLFVRINSTGKALTRAEKTKARYFSSAFLKTASQIAERHREYFKSSRVLTDSQLNRMKHVELICELMLSLQRNDVINKKAALDKAMLPGAIDGRQIQKAKRLTVTTLRHVKRLCPDIGTTRFAKVSDFYTFALLLGKYEQEGLILSDRRRNSLAWDLLKSFGRKVDEVSEQQKRAEGAKPEQEPYREYLLTVLRGTDEIGQRRRREKLIDGLIRSVFVQKDSQRLFTQLQRRIIWNAIAERVCQYPGCKAVLSWGNFTIDHIDPYSKGGRTRLQNAAIMCREHNSAKGNRTGPK